MPHKGSIRAQWEDYPPPVRVEGGCLRWQGTHHSAGYGLVGSRYAHREVWEREVGPIPEGYQIDHVATRGCVWRDCVEVAHLEPVPQAENVRRQANVIAQKARTHCPKGHPYAGENLRLRSTGQRGCRQCDRDSVRKAPSKTPEARRAYRQALKERNAGR